MDVGCKNRIRSSLCLGIQQGGSKILKKYWEKFTGILVSDGYATYRTVFSDNVKQRCVLHIYNVMQNIWQENQNTSRPEFFMKSSQICYIVPRVWSKQEGHSEKQRRRHARDLLNQTDCIIQQYMVGDECRNDSVWQETKNCKKQFVYICDVLWCPIN